MNNCQVYWQPLNINYTKSGKTSKAKSPKFEYILNNADLTENGSQSNY